MHSSRMSLLLLVAFALVACGPAVATPSPAAPSTPEPLVIEDGVLYVAIIWHQHQPIYGRDPETGDYVRPWVRVHAAKDYLDMATSVAEYPNIHVTFNLTPSLMQQLDDLDGGARDLYWSMTEIEAAQLSDGDKRFLLERFFDTNPRVIARFPRYQELSDMRGGSDPDQIDAALASWTTPDYRDLQVLFNLAWTDPDWLAEEPLASLVARGRDFEEPDKAVVLAEHLRLIREVIPTLAQLQQRGQIEITTTPFAHPILPLLVDSDLARVAMPEADLPARFAYGQDAVAQVELGVQAYQAHFGVSPRGMWPAEGSVAPLVISMLARAGIEWIASDEEVLARSLPGFGDFTRDSSDTVLQADALYRPYTVSGARGDVTILFRDRLLSDKIGFEYSGTSGELAAADLIQRLNRIQARLQEQGASGPHLVTVLLDGENAWEYYDNDGKDFLRALYQGLSEAPNLRTVTPSEYLAATQAPRALETLWSGSWINHDFSTWIGEEEENQAWTYLGETRAALETTLRAGGLAQAQATQALEAMYAAEGSDWFWWYGADQSSGSDDIFDDQFRGFLERVYTLIGQPPPDFVHVPIVAQSPQAPSQEPQALLSIAADGQVQEGEWAQAGFQSAPAGAPVAGFNYGFDTHNLYLRVDAAEGFSDSTTLGFYFGLPGGDPANAFSRFGRDLTLFGFGAKRLLEITFSGGRPAVMIYTADGRGHWRPSAAAQAGLVARLTTAGDSLEIIAPLAGLSSELGSGDRLNLRFVVSQAGADVASVPAGGPALLVTPDLPVPNVVVEVADPVGDDDGPGTYTYPTDRVFAPGVFDLTGMTLGSDEENVIFRLTIAGPINNHWNSPNGLSGQTVDIYIDVDGSASGERMLLPGRNAALSPEFAWDYAAWVEGWTPGLYQPGAEGPTEMEAEIGVTTNPGQRRLTITLPRSAIPGDPATWSIAVVLLGQEGYPAAGVWRVRDVNPVAEQWRFGGAPADTNHTRIIDFLWPVGMEPSQESLLGAYPPSQAGLDSLGVDDFAQLPMLPLSGGS